MDEVLTAQEGDFDADVRWALAWLVQSWPEIARLAREARGEQASLHEPPA